MSLTPEQETANRALETALDQVAAAFGHDGIRVASLVVASHTLFDGDEQCTSIQYHAPAGQNWITTLGLNRAVGLYLERNYLTPDT